MHWYVYRQLLGWATKTVPGMIITTNVEGRPGFKLFGAAFRQAPDEVGHGLGLFALGLCGAAEELGKQDLNHHSQGSPCQAYVARRGLLLAHGQVLPKTIR